MKDAGRMVKSAGTCIVNDSVTVPTKAMANVKLHFSDEVYESLAKQRGSILLCGMEETLLPLSIPLFVAPQRCCLVADLPRENFSSPATFLNFKTVLLCWSLVTRYSFFLWQFFFRLF